MAKVHKAERMLGTPHWVAKKVERREEKGREICDKVTLGKHERSPNFIRLGKEVAGKSRSQGSAELSDGVVHDPKAITPVQRLGDVYVKRDDLLEIAGVRGGKVRTCWQMAQGATGLTTAGSRQSPQITIVAHIAKKLGIPCHVHVAKANELTRELEHVKELGARLFQYKAGYNSLIRYKAREEAKEMARKDPKWKEIPFGMECEEAINQTKRQVANIPEGVKRIVVPVGSGMSLAGLLHGLKERGLDIPVLGIQVGADAEKRLDEYAPKDWRKMVKIVKLPLEEYHDSAKSTDFHGIQLDPIYEAKCIPFVKPGDLLWVVGVRNSSVG